MSIPIVGRRLSADEFDAFMKGFQFQDWKPSFVVVHNTAVPSLAQRPDGFTRQHMDNLSSYYGDQQKWKSGPHLFVDDHGIWLFSPLEKPGTHSPSWNGKAWGVEMLGDYDTEEFTSGRGAKVRDNAVRAVAALLKVRNLPANETCILFHKQDPKTSHKDCPGKRVVKSAFVAAVAAAMDSKPDGWTVIGPDGKTLRTELPTGAFGTGLVRAVVEAVGGSLAVDDATKTIRLKKAEEEPS